MENTSKKRVLRNAVISVIQVLLTGVTLFILYRFLLNTIGVARLGIWSAVLATTSVANMANFGLSGSVVKFVAKYIATGDEKRVAGVIETAAVSIGLLTGLIILVIMPFVGWILKFVMPVSSLQEALSIMPYSMASLWLVMMSGVFQAAHEGAQRYNIKSGIAVSGTILFLLMCFLFVPGHGLKGLAWSQVAQALFVACSSWLFLKTRVAGLSFLPCRWNKGTFREIVGYGFNFQLMSVCQMLFDPITKTLLVKFGGLSLAGFYEMASRMVLQVRAIIINANQVLVPAIADMHEKEPKKVKDIYRSTWVILIFISVPLLFSLAALAPVISVLWIGHYESPFVFFTVLLSIGWLINTLSGPAYFSNLGTGRLRGNLVGTISMALLNPVFCFLLGYYYGGYGVVIGWMVSLVSGSLLVTVMYHKDNDISFRTILTPDTLLLILAAVSASAMSLATYDLLADRMNIELLSTVMTLLYIAAIAWSVWRHPVRERLGGWGHDVLRNRREVQNSTI